ncbi:MAG: phosphoribosylanthranilate isomerase [Clostridia bacterium]
MSNLGDLRQDAQRLAGQNTRIKVCGLKRPEDIESVNQAKPDFCGFIVEFPRSSRCVSRELLAELTAQLDPEIIPVGVLVNAPVKLPAELAESGVIRAIQLHGQENEEYIRRLRRLIGGDIPVIQAFSVQTAEDLQRAAESSADYVLLDQGSGGTGKIFDWSLVEGFTRPFLLAGGLGTDNLAEAIERLSPWAVDLSSSLEIGGLKDRDKIIEAVNIVRSFEQLK